MAYANSKTITFDHTKVPGTDQTNFPALIAGTYSFLATVANGGGVTNSNGHDVAFYSNAGLTVQLSHEVERYNATTGEVIYWVKIPTLATATDTVIYIAYGDAGVVTSQENITDVWSNSFVEVFHLPNGTTLTANDSTSTNNDAATLTSVSATAAKIGGGASTSASIIHGFANNLSSAGNTRTVSAWINKTNTTRGGIVGTRNVTSPSGWVFSINRIGAGYVSYFNTSGITMDGNASLANSTWYHVAATFGSGTGEIFVNGASVTTASGSADLAHLSNGHIGCESSNAATPFVGSIDEVRIAHTKRNSNWLTTEYNYQNSPSTFYTIAGAVSTSKFLFWFL